MDCVVLAEHGMMESQYSKLFLLFFLNVAADYVQVCFLFIARALGKLAFCP